MARPDPKTRRRRPVTLAVAAACAVLAATVVAAAPAPAQSERVPDELQGDYRGSVDLPAEPSSTIRPNVVSMQITKSSVLGSVEYVTGGKDGSDCLVVVAQFEPGEVSYVGDNTFRGDVKGFVGRSRDCSSTSAPENDAQIEFVIDGTTGSGTLRSGGQTAPFDITLVRKTGGASPGTAAPPGTAKSPNDFSAIAEPFLSFAELQDVARQLKDRGINLRLDVPPDLANRIGAIRKTGASLSDEQKKVLQGLEYSLLLAHGLNVRGNDDSRAAGPAFPSLLAMEPVLLKLGATAVGPPYDEQAANALNNLVRMTIYLSLEGKAPR